MENEVDNEMVKYRVQENELEMKSSILPKVENDIPRDKEGSQEISDTTIGKPIEHLSDKPNDSSESSGFYLTDSSATNPSIESIMIYPLEDVKSIPIPINTNSSSSTMESDIEDNIKSTNDPNSSDCLTTLHLGLLLAVVAFMIICLMLLHRRAVWLWMRKGKIDSSSPAGAGLGTPIAVIDSSVAAHIRLMSGVMNHGTHPAELPVFRKAPSINYGYPADASLSLDEEELQSMQSIQSIGNSSDDTSYFLCSSRSVLCFDLRNNTSFTKDQIRSILPLANVMPQSGEIILDYQPQHQNRNCVSSQIFGMEMKRYIIPNKEHLLNFKQKETE